MLKFIVIVLAMTGVMGVAKSVRAESLGARVVGDVVVACSPELVSAIERLWAVIEDDITVRRAWLIFDTSDGCRPSEFPIRRRKDNSIVRVTIALMSTPDLLERNVVMFLEKGQFGSESLQSEIAQYLLRCDAQHCVDADK